MTSLVDSDFVLGGGREMVSEEKVNGGSRMVYLQCTTGTTYSTLVEQ
jgi:hypothetical protein